MKYRIDTRYCWYKNKTQIVLMYFINQVPFTFEDLPSIAKDDPEITEIADNEKSYEEQDLFKAYQYLMAEQCHHLEFTLDLENADLLPVD